MWVKWTGIGVVMAHPGREIDALANSDFTVLVLGETKWEGVARLLPVPIGQASMTANKAIV